MPDHSPIKHFLDTSVVRPMIHGTENYKKYYRNEFKDDNVYVSPYVRMEYTRGLIRDLINFYFVLDLPTIETTGDAFKLWSDEFGRSPKSGLLIVSEIFKTYDIDSYDPNDKLKALRILDSYIFRLPIIWKSIFKEIGSNETRCPKANIKLAKTFKKSTKESLSQFKLELDQNNFSSGNCRLSKFVVQRHKDSIIKYIEYASSLKGPKNSENIGFTKIVEKLDQALRGNVKFSCRLCGQIGDAIIALEMPSDMRLEHTDYAFRHLCDLISKLHHRHPSQKKFHQI